MEIELPFVDQKADTTKINQLLIISHQGTGKTTALSKLEGCLLLDYENGSEQVGGLKYNMLSTANKNNISLLRMHYAMIDKIKAANLAAGKPVYKYLGIDNVTALEKLARVKATIDFKNSIVGKGMINKGNIINDVVTDVPESGYNWLFKAWDDLYTSLQGLSSHGIIWLAHSKQGSLLKDGVKLEANDMQLTGKLKIDLLREVDAVGLIYKKDPNTVMINFKESERDLTIKARAQHLVNQEFVFSEKKDGNIIVHWEKIFV